jgi:asparagine synthase (glutamine-hydrolysing)
MCGIAGIVSSGTRGVEGAQLSRLAAAIAHRGPDGEGIWLDEARRCGLVHRRLAILDTSEGGHQPMRSAGDGRYAIVYNGEIFNFLELRTQLETKGHRFRGDSDTEVILAAWAEWGEDMLPRFNGMWALAIHDTQTGELFLSRDRFGIKPMLYSQRDGMLAFASEMRALRQLPWVSDDLDETVARRLLFDPFSIEASERTLFADIRRLPAGHSARWCGGRLNVRRWWCTADQLVEVPPTHEQRVARFGELFHDAVRLRMRSDVSIGTCLSGGFDSSAIVSEMSHVAAGAQAHRREAQDWRHAFIASFPGRSNDETPLALEAAGHARVTPHLLDLSEVNDTSIVDQMLTDLDDIYISLPAAPWQIYQALRQHGTLVSLDGHGADELMGGYRQAGATFAFALRNQLTGSVSHSARAERALDHLRMARLTHQGHAFLRGHRWQAPAGLELPAGRDRLPASWGPMNRRLYRLFHSTVLPTILRNFDRLSMAHGIEVRMPFMDWRLVCYVMSLPDAAKLDPIGSKAVARHAMAGRMPESIRISQRKVGFNSPMPEWMNGALGTWAQRVLSRPDERFDALVDTAALRQRVSALHSGAGWSWESVGRLWPYINLKWMLDRLAQPVCE